MHWDFYAACKDHEHPEWWFPTRYSKTDEERAKSYCDGCEVRTECLELGMAFKHGIFGGKTASEREALKRQRVRA